MENQDFYKLARNYMITNAIIGSAASKMAQLNREEAAKIAEIHRFYAHYKSDKEIADQVGRFMLLNRKAEAFAYLNNSLRNEMIHDCQNQKEFTTHLSEQIELRKDKYRPFYAKIEMEMPEDLETMTAEEICLMMSVELMTAEQLTVYHRQKEEKESGERLAEDVGLVFRAILIIGMLILMICLSSQ